MRCSIVIPSFLFCLAAFGAEASEPVDFSGEWWNTHCAQISLSPTGNRLSGRYRPKNTATNGQSFKLTGYRTGVDLIAFIVSLGPDGPLIAWTGQHMIQNGDETIIMKWHMTVDVPEEEETEDTLLASVSAGMDSFKRSKPKFCR
jgi:hypothetical protein